MRVEYREEPCKVALNRVKGMPFDWSLNPYMGCVAPLHVLLRPRVRAARRPALRRPLRHVDPRQGERRRASCAASSRGRAGAASAIAIGAATDPYQPAEGRYQLTRACLEALARRVEPVPDHHARPADRPRRRRARRGRRARADVSVTFSVPTVDDDVWRHDRARDGAAAAAPARAEDARRRRACAPRSAWRPSSPASPTTRARSQRVVVAAREAGACGIWANLLYLRPGTREHFLDCLARDWPELLPDYERLYARRRLPAAGRGGVPRRQKCGAWRRRTASATGGRVSCSPPRSATNSFPLLSA